MNTANIIILFVASLVAVGTLLVLGNRALVRQRTALFLETNAAIRALAKLANLAVNEPAARAGDAAFVEAHGTISGVSVRVSVEPLATDELWTAIFFPRRVLEPTAVDRVASLADRIANDHDGLTLYLSRATSFPKMWLLTYDRIPETNVRRLQAAVERACSLLTPMGDG